MKKGSNNNAFNASYATAAIQDEEEEINQNTGFQERISHSKFQKK